MDRRLVRCVQVTQACGEANSDDAINRQSELRDRKFALHVSVTQACDMAISHDVIDRLSASRWREGLEVRSLCPGGSSL